MKKKLLKETSYRSDYQYKGKDEPPVEISSYQTSYREFNEAGQVTLDITFLDDGSVDRKYIYEYEDGKLVDEKLYFGGDELTEHYSYVYEGDRLVKSYVHYQDGSKDTVSYDYDDSGLLIKKTSRDEDGAIEEMEERTYDNGNLTGLKRFEYGDMETPVLEEHNKYDENGMLIEHIVHDHQEEKVVKEVLEYDENGNENLLKTYVNDQLQEKAAFARNDQGRATEIIEEKPGQRIKILQEYDERGNPVKQEVYDRFDNQLYRADRKFDEMNNLQEAVVLRDDKGIGVFSMYKVFVDLEYQ